MHISKIRLYENARTTDVFWKVFCTEYTLHKAIWDLFSDDPIRRRDFLYRLDKIGKQPVVYAVSNREPHDSQNLWHIEKKSYDPKLHKNMRLGFTVRVNPTCKRNGKRHDVVMNAKYKMRSDGAEQKNATPVSEIVNESCSQWLGERSQKNGFSVIQMRADSYRQVEFNKIKGNDHVRFSTVDITGVLQVTDEGLFRKALFEGLGPEKGFGCGLMMVRKL